jgi:hydroxymethylpyrimidine kinase / phosphomethylpyrimidine kinase / thiamine-phosphate diphosphorylase
VKPCVWFVGGTDSSGGSGLAADLKTSAQFGVHGVSIVTMVTAQGPESAFRIEPTPSDLFEAQINAVRETLPPSAIKLGALGSFEILRVLAEELPLLSAPLICDPVLKTSSGTDLTRVVLLDEMKRCLFPFVDLLTPNLSELSALVGREILSPEEIPEAAREILEFGVKSVLVKGGHGDGELASDYWTDGTTFFWMNQVRIPGEARGTGCTLASAIASLVAKGVRLREALVAARTFLQGALRESSFFSKSQKSLAYFPWPRIQPSADLPWITEKKSVSLAPKFLEIGSLGFYPLVNRVHWLERLLPLGISIAQLRIKDLFGEDLRKEIHEAIQLCRRYHCRLFINDHWELALEEGAYGVHLGKEDWEQADLAKLRRAEMRLGMSTHGYEDLARALMWGPSYVALGPVFSTTTKETQTPPQGIERIREWKCLSELPLVVIGGISLERGNACLQAGADGIAVISDLMNDKNPEQRALHWLQLFTSSRRENWSTR